MNDDFIWCDLSTFQREDAQQFYQHVFGWTFSESESTDSDYHLAHKNDSSVTALFTMPEPLQALNLPSFWMSYIEVDDVQQTVAKARAIPGVIIEVEPSHFDNNSQYALIRDPSGAGFTVIQGTSFAGKAQNMPGHMVWNVHHVNDITLIKSFYEQVFDWRITPSEQPSQYNIHNTQGTLIAHIEEIPDSVKGPKQYWMPVFLVSSLESTIRMIEQCHGTVVSTLDDSRVMCADPQGGTFIITDQHNEKIASRRNPQQSSLRWKAMLALVIIWNAILMNASWFWGALMIPWIARDLKSGSTHLYELVTRQKHPFQYWTIILSWISIAAYLLASMKQ